jgi:hypothetical protein
MIVPDNDNAGWALAEQVAQYCYGKTSRIRMLRLPGVKDVSDWFERGRTAEELKQLADNCPDYQGPLPVIICNNRHLRDKSSDALGALYAANKPERIFQRGGVLCRIGRYEFLLPTVELPSDWALRGVLARYADFI